MSIRPRSALPRHLEERSKRAGPFVRVLEDRAVVTDATDTLAYHANGYLVDGRCRVRPSWARLGSSTAFGSGNPVQMVASARASTGAAVNFLAANGVLYAGAGVVPTTTIDLAGAGITLSAAARHVYAVSFADYLIVSDGVNRPFKVSLTTLVPSHLTSFTVPAYGPPVVYYAKLFFVVAGTRIEIQWSEEADPDTGYTGACPEGGTFNNAWELRQSDQDPLEALHATNDALVYWRGNNVGIVAGAVTPDFQAEGTHDGVEGTGTRSPGAIVRVGRRILFVDQRGRVCSYMVGADSAPSVSDPAVHTAGTPRASLADVLAAVVPDLERVVVAHPLQAGGDPTQLLVFNPNGPGGEVVYEGRWTGGPAAVRAMGTWLLDDRDDVDTLVVGDATGYAWGLLPALPPLHVDYTAPAEASPVAFTRRARTGALLSEPRTPKRLDLALVEVSDPPVTASGDALAGALTLDYTTSAGANVGDPLEAVPEGAADGELGSALIGLDGFGRWIALEITTDAADAAYDLVRVSVDGERLGDQPEG